VRLFAILLLCLCGCSKQAAQPQVVVKHLPTGDCEVILMPASVIESGRAISILSPGLPPCPPNKGTMVIEPAK
jgi:hypothetical protein